MPTASRSPKKGRACADLPCWPGYSQIVASDPVSLGEIIRRQRELSEMSMRRFAQVVGISNPYLSQIERGLRAPSERVMDAIAETLDVSADALYEQAGVRSHDEEVAQSGVVEAVKADPLLTRRQRQALIEVYEAFTAQTYAARPRRRRRASDGLGGGRSRGDSSAVD